MSLTRRQLLKAALGASQLGLLGALGGSIFSKPAFAAGSGHPTRLLTIYLPGGWMPGMFFCPMSSADINTFVPERESASSEPIYFSADQVRNFDGSDGGGGGFAKIRGPIEFDATAFAAGLADPRTNTSTPNGRSWHEHSLWEDACVVHGVDMGTAAHESARISAFCGAPGAVYRAPVIHSVVANALYEAHKDTRALPAVALGRGPAGPTLSLPATAAMAQLGNIESIAELLSVRDDIAWKGLRDRSVSSSKDFLGADNGELAQNTLERTIQQRMRRLSGKSNSGTDAFYQSIYESYQGVSRVLAQDVVGMLESAVGVEYTDKPFYLPNSWSHWGVDIGGGVSSDSGGAWGESFDLALKMMKSDLATSISLNIPGTSNYRFDAHSAGLRSLLPEQRAVMEVVGRFLGEMKATPAPNGNGTLLDDTLVMVFSEFSRTWPNSGTCDHWPITSTVFAGGGITGNRMIGGYDFGGMAANTTGPRGQAVDVIEEGGDAGNRSPRSADIVHTALKILGIDDFFIPGGSAEIVGVA